MRLRSFWWGVGITAAVWLWRRQLRPVAVTGAKVGVRFVEGIKDNLKGAKRAYFDLQQEAQLKKIKARNERGH